MNTCMELAIKVRIMIRCEENERRSASLNILRMLAWKQHCESNGNAEHYCNNKDLMLVWFSCFHSSREIILFMNALNESGISNSLRENSEVKRESRQGQVKVMMVIILSQKIRCMLCLMQAILLCVLSKKATLCNDVKVKLIFWGCRCRFLFYLLSSVIFSTFFL